MLEWLAAATGVELGKLVLDQVLNLGKAALDDYIKDFFKHCIGGVAQLKAETLKQPMAEAIGFFINRFIKELQLNDVPETSIEHHYKATIKRFVQDKAVRPILGTAFEKNCKQIDYQQLEQFGPSSIKRLAGASRTRNLIGVELRRSMCWKSKALSKPMPSCDRSLKPSFWKKSPRTRPSVHQVSMLPPIERACSAAMVL
jgi:predicted metalloprotease with PDZ domain